MWRDLLLRRVVVAIDWLSHGAGGQRMALAAAANFPSDAAKAGLPGAAVGYNTEGSLAATDARATALPTNRKGTPSVARSRTKKTPPQELLAQFARLEPSEREEFLLGLRNVDWFWLNVAPALLLRHVPQPPIIKTPGVCGGEARLIRTRIPVWTLARMRQLGVSEREILSSFPALQAVDLVAAWSYVDEHPEEIERAILENEQE